MTIKASWGLFLESVYSESNLQKCDISTAAMYFPVWKRKAKTNENTVSGVFVQSGVRWLEVREIKALLLNTMLEMTQFPANYYLALNNK